MSYRIASVAGMSSAALLDWQSHRAARIDRLRAAHTVIGDSGPVRRWLTSELNQPLILRLAAEFQGFARDLHNEASGVVVAALAPDDLRKQIVLKIPYTSARKLDRGNAEPGGLGQDFGLFGMDLWTELRRTFPNGAQRWQEQLRLLNTARNGLAHDDARRIAEVQAAGWPLTLDSVRRWRISLDGLAKGMDHVVGKHLQQVFGSTPW